eukprot:4891382-Pleurochrysis_carterae.AAC.2
MQQVKAASHSGQRRVVAVRASAYKAYEHCVRIPLISSDHAMDACTSARRTHRLLKFVDERAAAILNHGREVALRSGRSCKCASDRPDLC